MQAGHLCHAFSTAENGMKMQQVLDGWFSELNSAFCVCPGPQVLHGAPGATL